MVVYWVTGGVLLVYLVLVWFLGSWLQLHGSDLWICVAGLVHRLGCRRYFPLVSPQEQVCASGRSR